MMYYKVGKLYLRPILMGLSKDASLKYLCLTGADMVHTPIHDRPFMKCVWVVHYLMYMLVCLRLNKNDTMATCSKDMVWFGY